MAKVNVITIPELGLSVNVGRLFLYTTRGGAG
jgi:hypothetical protein